MFRKKDPSIDAAAGHAIAAIMILAAQDLPLRERLVAAWVQELSQIDADRLSPTFRKRFDAMAMEFPQDELAVDAVASLNSNETTALAERMVHFALDLELVQGAWMK